MKRMVDINYHVNPSITNLKKICLMILQHVWQSLSCYSIKHGFSFQFNFSSVFSSRVRLHI